MTSDEFSFPPDDMCQEAVVEQSSDGCGSSTMRIVGDDDVG